MKKIFLYLLIFVQFLNVDLRVLASQETGHISTSYYQATSDFPSDVPNDGSPSSNNCEPNANIIQVILQPRPVQSNQAFFTKPVLDVDNPCGFCEASINGIKVKHTSYLASLGGPPGGGCSGAEIPPSDFVFYEISESNTNIIKWVYFPPNCTDEQTCGSRRGTIFKIGTEIGSVFNKSIDDLRTLNEDLVNEGNRSSVRALKLVANKVKRTISLADKALLFAQEEDLDSCNNSLNEVIKSLDDAILLFEERQCKRKISRRCISKTTINQYLPELENIFDLVEEEISLDSDLDGVADLCVVEFVPE